LKHSGVWVTVAHNVGDPGEFVVQHLHPQPVVVGA
jgi:hypothetical protein